MAQLLRAQAYRCNSPLSEVRVNTQGDAKDDGSDGWSAKPSFPDDWLGFADTCWQLKAGTRGQPQRLGGEVCKRIPRETLLKGGRFVVVASGSTNGRKGEEDRKTRLVSDAVSAGIPTGAIEVIGSERLSVWCNHHPAIAACWASRPDGLWSLQDWRNSDEHQVPWQAPPNLQTAIADRRAELDFISGGVYHLHIQGPPGVGKTRFALELCRDAPWRGSVVYIRQASDLRLSELIDSASVDNGVRLTLVADEVQPEQLRPLRDSIGRANGRIRLITVGHSPTPDPTRIPAFPIAPLDNQSMKNVVKGWYPAMPPEHIDFVARFADGYVRLAKLAADAVARGSVIDIRGLLSREEIRGFLNGMLGTGDRRALHVVAVLNSVGWMGDVQSEGEAISLHFGLDWNHVRASVEDFDRRLGIAPRSGRYRYITPTPLGIHLAVEAWTTYPDLLRTLPRVLPSESATNAYYGRLRSMTSNPQAREYAREELAFFFRIDDFKNVQSVQRWSALSAADPDLAARNLRKALATADCNSRKQIDAGARREIVSTLVRFAWRQSSFHSSVWSLALLAEAETETWANNASAEFVARFQVYLGGTAVPYLNRLNVLDELLAEGRDSLTRLTVKALAKVGDRQSSRMESSPASDELREAEWWPRTGREYLECVEASLSRLTNIAKRANAEIRDELIVAANHLSMLLRESAVRSVVVEFFESLRRGYPDSREELRVVIADLVNSERRYWKELSTEELQELESLHHRFEDSALGSRLQQQVGPPSWYIEERPDLRPLAQELLSTPEVLAEYWSWLTSGEAADVWFLGEALAEVDLQSVLAETLPLLSDSGRDHRLLSGYINAKRRIFGNEWLDRWVASQIERHPRQVQLIFEIAWRCEPTDFIANTVAETLRTGSVNAQTVDRLGIGRWGEHLGKNTLQNVLRAMMDSGHRATAVAILAHRLKSHPAEVGRWERLALELVTATDIIRSTQTTSYAWKEVTSALLESHAAEIASAIFREQSDRESGTWFAEYGNAAGILRSCAKMNPAGVWRGLAPYLSSRASTYRFGLGFPRDLVDLMPRDEVTAWIAESPEERAVVIAQLTTVDLSTDDTLAARLIAQYGDHEGIGSAFFASYVSGSWSGPSSTRWDALAAELEITANRTTLQKLRSWALESARSLRKMAERDREWEEEEEVRRR